MGCLYWREDHEPDCVIQTKAEPLSDAASPGCMKKPPLHNCIMPSDVPSSATAGPRGWRSDREEAGSPPSLPPFQHGKAQESCCVGKKTLTYLLGKSRAALERRLTHRAAVMDQREPSTAASTRCVCHIPFPSPRSSCSLGQEVHVPRF